MFQFAFVAALLTLRQRDPQRETLLALQLPPAIATRHREAHRGPREREPYSLKLICGFFI